MKNKIILILLAIVFVSCELTDVVDQDPPNNLVPENVVNNEEDAEALLNGVYSTIISFSSAHYYMYSELIPAGLSGSMSSIGTGTANAEFVQNDLHFDNGNVNSFWQIIYKMMNGANNTISLVGELPDAEFSGNKKSEIIGEAHFLRAMATFDALRYFGQFYDLNSRYGVILRTEPVNFVTRSIPRSTVVESYNQILSDLDFAIANAPDFSVTFRGSKTAAKSLKARVLLFMGNYDAAAQMADEVITDQTRVLETGFASVFSKGLNSSEMILMTHRHSASDTEDNNRKRFYGGRTGTTWLPAIFNGDPRKALTYNGTTILKVNNVTTFRPTYFIRLAEMYLIKAEALAQLDNFEQSKVALDKIRTRAGLQNSLALTIADLKEDIFAEWVRELVFENGSEWFAAIRFNKAMQLKPAITSVNQYILPIPEDELFGNATLNLSDQNPGYE